jgi:hypothetical protein
MEKGRQEEEERHQKLPLFLHHPKKKLESQNQKFHLRPLAPLQFHLVRKHSFSKDLHHLQLLQLGML